MREFFYLSAMKRFLSVLALMFLLSACQASFSDPAEAPLPTEESEQEQVEEMQGDREAMEEVAEETDEQSSDEEMSFEVPEYRLEKVVEGLEIPWALVWTSADRLLITERPGRVRQVVGGELLAEPLHVFDNILEGGEQGLLGMVKDPNYEDNQYLYICASYRNDGNIEDHVLRFRDAGDSLEDETLLLGGIPAARYHAGCEIAFGPDGKLYITTGDALRKELADDPNSLAGKTLRMNADGSVPEDNPTAGSFVWSSGHRNAQGIDWSPLNGELYSAEHGPSSFDGPPGGDEVNRIVKGEHYGWPHVSHEESLDPYKDPLEVYTPAFAPGSSIFVREGSEVFPEGSFLVAGLRGEDIRLLFFDEENPDEVLFSELLGLEVGRIREIMQGPDGAVYFATSNRDGRGTVRDGDDVVYKVVRED